ncbi:hypothetical protein HY857_01080 [Candidatus Saccharibacteria bacterium]|nr:hypothetical protein [Candidatus Saccharibacteria bacterium]
MVDEELTTLGDLLGLWEFFPDGFRPDDPAVLAMIEGGNAVVPFEDLEVLLEIGEILSRIDQESREQLFADLRQSTPGRIKSLKPRYRRAVQDVLNWLDGGKELYRGVSDTEMRLDASSGALDTLLAIAIYAIRP